MKVFDFFNIRNSQKNTPRMEVIHTQLGFQSLGCQNVSKKSLQGQNLMRKFPVILEI